jgi:hypothetical protein
VVFHQIGRVAETVQPSHGMRIATFRTQHHETLNGPLRQEMLNARAFFIVIVIILVIAIILVVRIGIVVVVVVVAIASGRKQRRVSAAAARIHIGSSEDIGTRWRCTCYRFYCCSSCFSHAARRRQIMGKRKGMAHLQ